MKRTYRFAESLGSVRCEVSSGRTIEVPVFPGILKHPAAADLPRLLQNADVVRKYTRTALRKAAWQILRRFPREWLKECLADVEVRPGRRKALEYLLS